MANIASSTEMGAKDAYFGAYHAVMDPIYEKNELIPLGISLCSGIDEFDKANPKSMRQFIDEHPGYHLMARMAAVPAGFIGGVAGFAVGVTGHHIMDGTG